tara:strand:+ start:162 stop:389 length:228 start_codon:yes stop_codon:yes gene_type:complete
MKRDGRKLWLGECFVNSAKLLANSEKIEERRELTSREAYIKQVAAAFCYLYHKIEDEGLLRPDDEDNFFINETIH